MKTMILGLMFLIYIPGLSFADATSSLAFKEMTATVDIGKPYGMVKIEVVCSSTQDNVSRKFVRLAIKTKNKEFTAPESMLAAFNNPGDFMIHGGVVDEKVNFFFRYEKKPRRFDEGRILFKNGVFSVW